MLAIHPAPARARAVDPVCGAVVDPDHAPRAAYAGLYHFCSMDCRERFVADPRHFAALAGGAAPSS